jgi:hypothetical protein
MLEGHVRILRAYSAAQIRQYSVASFATLRLLNCLHSPVLRCSYCNVVRSYCDSEACNLVVVIIYT